MVQRDRRTLVFKILTVTLFLVLLVSNACLGQPNIVPGPIKAPGPSTIFPGPSTQQTIVLNLLYGQQYFGVPHIYQGYISNASRVYYVGASVFNYTFNNFTFINFTATLSLNNTFNNFTLRLSKWPMYYGPSNASLYWAEGNLNSDQPVLELVPIRSCYPGVMFWNGYFDGGNITVSMIGTYSGGSLPPSGGFVIYLFLNPTTWNISPQYNYTIINDSTIAPESPVGDTILLPQSSIPYLIIQWEPYWQFGYMQSGATGQWNVWIVNNPSGNNASVGPYPSPNLGYFIIRPHAGWDGIGTGAFQPNPGDLIDITVTYDPSTNTLTGIAYDMNTTQSASFTLNLNGYYTPPSSGNYVFGVGAGIIGSIFILTRESYNFTGIYNYTGPGLLISFDSFNNWALLYTAVSQQSTTPPTPSWSSSSTGLNLIPYFYNSSAMGGVYLNFTKAELGLFMPPVMLGNLSIPGIIDFNSMSYFAHTLEGPYVFNTTLGGWKVYGFTFIALPTYGNGSVVNPTYMLQKTMIIAYNGGKVIVLLYYRNLAPVSLELNQYWSHIHKGVDGLSFAVYPASFNPHANATEQVIQDAYYIDGNTSLYVKGSYLGRLNSFGLWQVLPAGPITLMNNASGWIIQLIPMNNLSTTQQIQLVTNGFSINGITIANSHFDIQHAKVTLIPNQSAQYVYSIGINTQPPNYTEIIGILNYLLQIASSSIPQTTSSSSSLAVQVFNVLGRLATTVPGVVYGVLYNSSGFKEVAFMNSSGFLNFNNIAPGTYTLKVYHYPNTGLNITEYWGGMTVNLQPGSNFVTFARHEPWIYNLQAVENGARITINVTVYNPLNAILHGELYIWVTTSPQTANPSKPTINTSITIGPGLNKFTYYYATTQNGTYYIYAALLIYNRTQLITTDQWNWTAVPKMYQLTVIIINPYGASGTWRFELYKSNNYFQQGQIVGTQSITFQQGQTNTMFSFDLTPGVYEYFIISRYPVYSVVPSTKGFIDLTHNEVIYLYIYTSTPTTLNLVPIGLSDTSQWYVVWNGTIILTPEKNGAIPVSLFVGPNKNTIDLKFYSTNPQYHPLLPIVQLNATSLFKFNNEIYAVPFVAAGYPAHIVDWNGVQWNPLLDEYSQPNFNYTYYNQDGFCWGMSSTAILYYLGTLPLPSQGASYTNQLSLGQVNGNGYLEYLTDASLAVAVHQILDPANNVTILRSLKNADQAEFYIKAYNEPEILVVQFPKYYHAVVAWGYVKEPNGDVVFLVYDPNYPQIITYAIYNPKKGSFIYIDEKGNVGKVIAVVLPTPVYLSWFNPKKFKSITQQQVQILQGSLLDYTLYVSTKPLKVYTGGELVGYFIDNKYFVTASTVQPGELAGYVDGPQWSRLYIVAVRNDFNASVDPNSTLVALRFANVSGTIMVYGFVVNSTGLVAVRFVNQSSFVMASPSSTVVKLELFSVTNSSVKTYNTTLWLSNGTGYVVNANFTNLTNATIR